MNLKCRKCSYVTEVEFDTVEEGRLLVCSHCGQYQFVHLYPTEREVSLADKYEKSVEMGYFNQVKWSENLSQWEKFMNKFEGFMEKEFKKENE